jgi:hypothetical protein
VAQQPQLRGNAHAHLVVRRTSLSAAHASAAWKRMAHAVSDERTPPEATVGRAKTSPEMATHTVVACDRIMYGSPRTAALYAASKMPLRWQMRQRDEARGRQACPQHVSHFDGQGVERPWAQRDGCTPDSPLLRRVDRVPDRPRRRAQHPERLASRRVRGRRHCRKERTQ